MPPPAPPVLNIAAYRFTALDDLPVLRQRLLDSGSTAQLKGTVLLAPEGINLSLAGDAAGIDGWLAGLQADARLAGLTVKRSHSALQPFQRLKVKIKREIIRMDGPTLRPATARAPAVDAATLARWIAHGRDDDGRPLKLLDTRNAFEVAAGRFAGALDWGLQKFSDFPAALAAHKAELVDARIVSYCTGGIRCEKAALVMQDMGLAHTVQLDGGILQYFADTQGQAPGWQGDCVVFDERGALSPTLSPAGT